MIKRIYLILMSTAVLCAETSIFSSRGIGDLHFSKSSCHGMAVQDTLTVNTANYAGWAGISNTYFNLSFDYVNHDVKSNTGASSYDDIAISGFSFALPFGDRNFFGLNLSPYSVSNIQNSFNQTKVGDFENMYYTGIEKSIGSFNNFSLIYGKAIKNFAFAVDASCIFGSINKSLLWSVGNSEPSATSSFDVNKYMESNNRVSALVFNPGLSAVYRWQNYAAAAKISVPLFNDFETSESLKLYDKYSLLEEVKKEGNLKNCEWPVSFGTGFAWSPDKWQISGDLFYTTFSGTKLGLSATEDYADYWKISAQAKYHHSSRLLAPYYQKMSYQGGLSIEQRPVKFNNSVVNDYTLFGSITTPFSGNQAAVETNLSYTLSGDKTNNGFQDKIWRIGFTFHNSNSWWLRKTRYDE